MVIAALLTGGIALALPPEALAQTGGSAGGATAASPGTTAIVPPQTPPTGQTNPGVTPSAPGPSNIAPGSSSSSGTAAPRPGFAQGGGGHRQPRANDVPQNERSADDAIKELDKELSRKLSICRGC